MQKAESVPATQRVKLLKTISRMNYSENTALLIAEIIGDSEDEAEKEEKSCQICSLIEESVSESSLVSTIKETFLKG